MMELQKQLAVCLNVVDQTVQLVNNQLLPQQTLAGTTVYMQNPTPLPLRTLLDNLKLLLPHLKKYSESYHNRLEQIAKTLVSTDGKLNPYQFGGIIQLLGIVKDEIDSGKKVASVNSKPIKLFISHAEKDKVVVEAFVDLLARIGFTSDNLFCSSVTGYDIPVGSGDIFDYLKNEFESNNLFVVCLLSTNYYKSAACLNEMGASWVKSCSNQSILLPDFKYKNIKGAINPRDISFILNNQYRLTEFKELLVQTFELTPISQSLWQKYQDDFIHKITSI